VHQLSDTPLLMVLTERPLTLREALRSERRRAAAADFPRLDRQTVGSVRDPDLPGPPGQEAVANNPERIFRCCTTMTCSMRIYTHVMPYLTAVQALDLAISLMRTARMVQLVNGHCVRGPTGRPRRAHRSAPARQGHRRGER
jgi:hypothetical protein